MGDTTATSIVYGKTPSQNDLLIITDKGMTKRSSAYLAIYALILFMPEAIDLRSLIALEMSS